MKKAYDFSRGKRGAALPASGKTRITIYLDDAVLERFRKESERTGRGYQTLINDALAETAAGRGSQMTVAQVRKIVREELAHR